VVKKHAVPFSGLHKKTYFNALEKILISPRHLKTDDKETKTINDSAAKAFEDVFKQPPSRMESEFPQLRLGKKTLGSSAMGTAEQSLDSNLSGQQAQKVESSWFD